MAVPGGTVCHELPRMFALSLLDTRNPRHFKYELQCGLSHLTVFALSITTFSPQETQRVENESNCWGPLYTPQAWDSSCMEKSVGLTLASRVSHSDVLKSLDSLAQLVLHSLYFRLGRKHTYSPLQLQMQNELLPTLPFAWTTLCSAPQSPNSPSVPMGGGDKQGRENVQTQGPSNRRSTAQALPLPLTLHPHSVRLRSPRKRETPLPGSMSPSQ